MVIHEIIKAVSYCPDCTVDEIPVKMKRIGEKTVCDKFVLIYLCEKCGHYFESYVQGPQQIDDFRK